MKKISSIIELLFDDENQMSLNLKDYHRINNKFRYEEMDFLNDTLNGELKGFDSNYEKIVLDISDLAYEDKQVAFIEGFKQGVKNIANVKGLEV